MAWTSYTSVGCLRSAGLYPNSSLGPKLIPPLTPPPHSQLVKQYGLWSRPLPPCELGIRPNSVVHRTIVSSSSPTPLQVL